MSKIMIDPSEAIDLQKTQDLIFVDVRSQEDYEAEHILNAVNIPDIFFYLATTTPKGLDELKNNFEESFSKAGISKDKTVIIYEDALNTRFGGSCRGYWIMQYLGHKNARVLNGGFEAWKEEGLPVTSDATEVEATHFEATINSDILATVDDVANVLDDPNIILLDNRDKVEWIGESSSPYGVDFAPRKGRIPGAKWIEWYNLMEGEGASTRLKSEDEIKSILSEQGISPDDDIIIFCFKGARASNTYVALKESGFKKLRVYFGSWNEWSRDPNLPIDEGVLGE